MKRFSAQYIITATGSILKRGIITTDDDGLIIDIIDTQGEMPELSSTSFFNGVIVPGFINCHCHLELSGMKGMVDKGTGLGRFLNEIREKRIPEKDESLKSIIDADRQMYREGIIGCADICNTDFGFEVKEESMISYVNLLEVFGIDPEKADKRINEIIQLKSRAIEYSQPHYIVPHTVYSLSVKLFEKVRDLGSNNDITSIHFLESDQERKMLSKVPGEMMESYVAMGFTPEILNDIAADHINAVKELITTSGNLILVHNTFVTEDDINQVEERGNVYWCLCPGSNKYIENTLPPVDLFRKNDSVVVLGTDSLASNDSLSIISEMKLLQTSFPYLKLEELVIWASKNGADALCMNENLGTIEVGKKPGLVLIENCNLQSFKLTQDSQAKRLI